MKKHLILFFAGVILSYGNIKAQTVPDKKEILKVTGFLDHCNINVTDIERSIKFYEEAVGLHVNSRMEAKDGSFIIVKLTDDKGLYELELTWLKDHPQPYELGDNESHICFRVAEDYNEVFEFHKSKGWVCYENHDMHLYFINDPDGYWIEILPVKNKSDK